MEGIGAIALPESLGLALIVILIAILVDTVLGICIALKDGVFDWAKMTKFFLTGVLPYVGGILVLALAAEIADVYFKELFFAIGTIIALKYSAEILVKIKLLFDSAKVALAAHRENKNK